MLTPPYPGNLLRLTVALVAVMALLAGILTCWQRSVPLVSGRDVLRWIRAHPIRHSLIVFTSSTEPKDIAAAYQAGANSYLVQPTTVNALKEVALEIRNYWLRVNVPPNEPRPR